MQLISGSKKRGFKILFFITFKKPNFKTLRLRNTKRLSGLIPLNFTTRIFWIDLNRNHFKNKNLFRKNSAEFLSEQLSITVLYMGSAGENSCCHSVEHKPIFTNSAFYFFLLKVGFVKIRRLPNIP